jgi:hypothetical protein
MPVLGTGIQLLTDTAVSVSRTTERNRTSHCWSGLAPTPGAPSVDCTADPETLTTPDTGIDGIAVIPGAETRDEIPNA